MSNENIDFRDKLFQKKIKKYFADGDFFALFYIYANFLEFNLKLILIEIHLLEEAMLHITSEGKIDTHESYPRGGTLGQNIRRLNGYKIKNLDGLDWPKLIQNLTEFNKVRNDLVHHLYAHTSIDNFEVKLKEGVEKATYAVEKLQLLGEYISKLSKKTIEKEI